MHLEFRPLPVLGCIALTTALLWIPTQPANARDGARAAIATPKGNPLFHDKFTADPAPLVAGDRLYLYVGHDEAQRDEMFNIREWLVYSTADMKTWTDHGPIMKATDFKWAKADAWASQAIEKNGKFWFYAAVEHDDTHPGKAIAVAVADTPTGPFVDAKGAALITNDMTPKGTHSWEDIDPTVFTDDDGTTWIAWGNRQCYIARLKPNMIELDGPITEITPPHFEEGPWLHKRGALYYLTYASLDRSKHRDEKVSYATAPSIQGPWTYRGELTGSGKYSFTIHPGIAQFKGNWYLFLHNAALAIGDQNGSIGRRAVTVEFLQYNADGSLKPVVQTEAGISVPPPRESASLYFPELADRAKALDPGALQQILTQADKTLPGERLEELAEMSSRYVTRAPDVFVRAQATRPGCFGVGFLGSDFVDNPGARTRERAARRKALETVVAPELATTKARCLGELSGK